MEMTHGVCFGGHGVHPMLLWVLSVDEVDVYVKLSAFDL